MMRVTMLGCGPATGVPVLGSGWGACDPANPRNPYQLIGRINKCGVISPRFDLALGKIEQWCNNLLPSRQFGYIVMTTSLGIMDHEEVQPGPNLSRCLSQYQPVFVRDSQCFT